MSTRRILLIQGHPDPHERHLCHALADAYAQGATQAGHAVRRVEVSQLSFALLRSQKEWEEGAVPDGLRQAQEDIAWCDHMVFFFPLWLGDMPAVLKGFLEQVARPDFAFERKDGSMGLAHKKLKGRSARVVVTMGMPALVYRWYFRAHSVRSLERNILGYVGIGPVRETLVGLVGNFKAGDAARWLRRLDRLGSLAG
jgi:putative NADPH-quinone reductase